VNATIADPTALGGYQLRLPTFEGPLDVLLRLIERDQLAITDVSLVGVTDQFLAYLDAMDEAPPATVAEFAAVGGRLVLLKSRSLLPRPAVVEASEDPEDLVRQLAEYRAVRAAASHLAMRDQRAAGAFLRGEGVALPDSSPPRLAIHQAGSLARALRRRLTAAATPRAGIATRPIITLREMTERLLVALRGASAPLVFGRFCGACQDRNEVLVAFLAMLALIRRRVIEVEQAGLFGEIMLRESGSPPALRTVGSPSGESFDA